MVGQNSTRTLCRNALRLGVYCYLCGAFEDVLPDYVKLVEKPAGACRKRYYLACPGCACLHTPVPARPTQMRNGDAASATGSSMRRNDTVADIPSASPHRRAFTRSAWKVTCFRP